MKWLAAASRGYRCRIATASLAGALRIGCGLGFVWVSKLLIDIASAEATGSITAYAVALVALVVAQFIFSAWAVRTTTRSDALMQQRLRERTFAHLMRSQWADVRRLHSADIANRLTDDTAVISALVCRDMPAFITNLVQFAGAGILFLILDPRLCLALVAVMPAAILVSRLYVGRMRHITKEIRTADSLVQQTVQESVTHQQLLKAMQREPEADSRLGAVHSDLMRMIMRRTTLALASRASLQAGFSVGYVVVLLWGVAGLGDGAITFGTMAAFLQLVSQLQRPTLEIARMGAATVHASASVERVAELLGFAAEPQGDVAPLCGNVGVRFSDVTFGYDDSAPIISNFSEDFVPGSVTTVTGATGVGKSTMMKLIEAIVRPQAGRVVFYDEDGHEAEASAATRRLVAYVPQGNSLLAGTVRDNLLLGSPEATDEEMMAALHTAAADFVAELPAGLDTPCGEQGAGLSEGQAQRVAIARALLQQKPVLLMDEPTSALDHATATTLLERLAASHSGRTVIMVTHRAIKYDGATACEMQPRRQLVVV